MTTVEHVEHLNAWVKKNPWRLINTKMECGGTIGRFPTKKAAVAAAKRFNGGYAVHDCDRMVSVSETYKA